MNKKMMAAVGAVGTAAIGATGGLIVNFQNGQVLTGDALNTLQLGKLNVTNGAATGLSVTGGAIDPTTTIAGVAASSYLHPDATGAVATPGGSIAGPQQGDRLGLFQSAYQAPNPSFNSSVTITAPQPVLNLRSIYGAVAASFWQDWNLNLNIQPNVAGARVNVLTQNGALQVQDAAGSAAIWLVAYGGTTFPITADSGGGLAIGNTGVSGGTGAGTSGAAASTSIYLNGNTVRVGNTFDTNTADCGSVSGSSGCIPVTTSSGVAGYVPFVPKGN